MSVTHQNQETLLDKWKLSALALESFYTAVEEVEYALEQHASPETDIAASFWRTEASNVCELFVNEGNAVTLKQAAYLAALLKLFYRDEWLTDCARSGVEPETPEHDYIMPKGDIDRVYRWALEKSHSSTPESLYAQGVAVTLEWLTGEKQDPEFAPDAAARRAVLRKLHASNRRFAERKKTYLYRCLYRCPLSAR